MCIGWRGKGRANTGQKYNLGDCVPIPTPRPQALIGGAKYNWSLGDNTLVKFNQGDSLTRVAFRLYGEVQVRETRNRSFEGGGGGGEGRYWVRGERRGHHRIKKKEDKIHEPIPALLVRSAFDNNVAMVRWVVGSILHGENPLSYFSFTTGINKDRGMSYPICGMVHIKEPLLLIGKSSPCGGNVFPLSLSEWSFTICLTPYKR